MDEEAKAVLRRLEALERGEATMAVQLIEQEHRLLQIWRNFAHYHWRPTPEHREPNWADKRRAARWALLWRVVSPATAAAGSISVLAVLGAWFAYDGNQKLEEQNSLIDRQNKAIISQLELQTRATHETRRAQAMQILHEVWESCDPDDFGDMGDDLELCEWQHPWGRFGRCRFKHPLSVRWEALVTLTLAPPLEGMPPLQLSSIQAHNTHLEPHAYLVRANLRDSDLLNLKAPLADMSLANLSGSNLTRANLSGANLSGAALIETNLNHANLQGADLSNACLRDAILEGADLRNADLRGASLQGASIYGANFDGAHLEGANLVWAGQLNVCENSGEPASFKGAFLEGANLSAADFRGSKLNDTQLAATYYVLDAGVERANAQAGDTVASRRDTIGYGNPYGLDLTKANPQKYVLEDDGIIRDAEGHAIDLDARPCY